MEAKDFLVHFSNVLLLVSYSVRNILWLRWFAVAAALVGMPFYLLRHDIIWPPILWGLVFTLINLYQITMIYLQRRPVVFTEEEQKLYDLGFRSLQRRDFLSLVMRGEWRKAVPGEQILAEGQTASSVCVAIDGELSACRQGKPLGTLKPGQLIGTAVALTGRPSSISASFSEDARYIRWPLKNVQELLERKPELRVTLQRLVNRDLADKLEALVSSEPAHAGS